MTIPFDSKLFGILLGAALERGGDYADIYVQRSRIRALHFEEGKVKSATDVLNQGVGIRVQQGEATGYAACDDLDPASLLAAAHRASAIAQAGGGPAMSQPLRPIVLPDRYPQRRPLAGLALAERISLARRASERAFAADARVHWVSVNCADVDDEVIIATSDGVVAEDRRPRLVFSVSVTGALGDRKESAGYGRGGRYGIEYMDRRRPEDISNEAVRRLVVKLIADEAPVGCMPVIIASGGAGGVMLHEAVGHGLEADFNRKHISAYSDKVGQMVANPLVSVFDRGDVVGDAGSLNVDDEGVVPTSTSLIENGRLVGYINDRLSARLMGVPCSGNGRRQSYQHVALPRMRITCLGAGPHARDDIIRSVKRGLYVASVGGGSVDITKGDFNFNVDEAYLIEDGRIGRPVRGACLIGNGPEVMRRVGMLGDDLQLDESVGQCGKHGQAVPVGFGTPTILVSEMTVGGIQA